MSTIRFINKGDAEKFLALRKQLDSESQFMMLEPGERKTTLEEQAQFIQRLLSDDRQAIFVVEENGELIGYLSVNGEHFARNQHTSYIVIGILAQHTGKGFGTALFERMEAWARERQMQRLPIIIGCRTAHACFTDEILLLHRIYGQRELHSVLYRFQIDVHEISS